VDKDAFPAKSLDFHVGISNASRARHDMSPLRRTLLGTSLLAVVGVVACVLNPQPLPPDGESGPSHPPSLGDDPRESNDANPGDMCTNDGEDTDAGLDGGCSDDGGDADAECPDIDCDEGG
jgi:hypothetical protein